MAIKRLSFYVTDVDVSIKSDHLPLKKFLNKQTMNSKVNDWAVELEQFRLHLEWILGSQNLLADSLNHFIDVMPDAQQADEPKNPEFGSYCFKELEPAKKLQVVSTEIIESQVRTSKKVDCSQKLQKLSKIDGSSNGVTGNNKEKARTHAEGSKFSEHSQNSWVSNEVEMFELKYNKKPLRKRSLLDSNESGKHSWNSQMDPCIKVTEHEDVREIALPLKPKQLQELQKNDTYCGDIAKKLHKNVELQKIFIKEKGILYRLWTEDGRTFKCILVPQVLQDFMIILAHDYSRHNDSRRTYSCLK